VYGVSFDGDGGCCRRLPLFAHFISTSTSSFATYSPERQGDSYSNGTPKRTPNHFFTTRKTWKKANKQRKQTIHRQEKQDERKAYYETQLKNHETEVSCPDRNDVLLGQGGAGPVYKHHGNECYRKMGAERVQTYVFCANEDTKRLLCTEVLQYVLQSGGIFRKQDHSSEQWITVSYDVAYAKVRGYFTTEMCKVKKGAMAKSPVEPPDFSKPPEMSQVLSTSTLPATETASVEERLEMIGKYGDILDEDEEKHTYKVETVKRPDLNFEASSVVSQQPEIVWTFFLMIVMAQIVFLDEYILIKIFYMIFPAAPYFKSRRLLNPLSMDARYDGPLRMISLALRENGYRLKNTQVYDVYDVNSPYHALQKFNYELADQLATTPHTDGQINCSNKLREGAVTIRWFA
jgi:hypothetical protein